MAAPTPFQAPFRAPSLDCKAKFRAYAVSEHEAGRMEVGWAWGFPLLTRVGVWVVLCPLLMPRICCNTTPFASKSRHIPYLSSVHHFSVIFRWTRWLCRIYIIGISNKPSYFPAIAPAHQNQNLPLYVSFRYYFDAIANLFRQKKSYRMLKDVVRNSVDGLGSKM